ncbi:MAG: hypothetical protein IT237_11765, partial [Bacteroidia bacterium]|nr:hypothetical protein [Bacteroidia bacterium]
MLLKHTHLLIIFTCLIASLQNAQNRNFSFQHYGPEDGLSNSNIFSIKQNKTHIIYLATENGVYHFDGYKFEKIKPKNTLKSNFIRNIDFNENNDLLIINRREGVYEYNSKRNEATLNTNFKFKNLVDEL